MTEEKQNEVRLMGALALVSLGKGNKKQLFDAVMAWGPVREMVERLARS